MEVWDLEAPSDSWSCCAGGLSLMQHASNHETAALGKAEGRLGGQSKQA